MKLKIFPDEDIQRKEPVRKTKKLKVVVAHPEQQHSFRLATALKKSDCLDKYFTTVYYKKGNFTSFAACILPNRFSTRAKTRRCEALNDAEVKQFCEIEGLLKLLGQYFPPLKKHYFAIRNHVADRFAQKVAKYAIKNNVDVVITYDNCSPVLFRELKEKAPKIIRVLDMSAANLFYMKEIYERDFELAPKFAERLRKERLYIWDEEYMERIKEEIENAQYFLTPSEFVEKSLKYSGIKDDQFLMCPYGVDVNQFSMKQYMELCHKPLEFIYVGGVKELKGISYLLKAFSEISPDDARLTVVGEYNEGDADVKEFENRVTFTGVIMHDDVEKYLKKSDVFVFPSLGDSFSLSALEAASCGLPLIVSDNTGMKDLMTDGDEGFIIDYQSSEDIKDAVMWFVNHPDDIILMGKKARKMAEKATWSKYYERVSEICIGSMQYNIKK